MQRRDIFKAGAASFVLPAALARPALAQPAAARVLKFIPQADVAVLDPIITTAYVTRNHASLPCIWLTWLWMPARQAFAGHEHAPHVRFGSRGIS